MTKQETDLIIYELVACLSPSREIREAARERYMNAQRYEKKTNPPNTAPGTTSTT